MLARMPPPQGNQLWNASSYLYPQRLLRLPLWDIFIQACFWFSFHLLYLDLFHECFLAWLSTEFNLILKGLYRICLTIIILTFVVWLFFELIFSAARHNSSSLKMPYNGNLPLLQLLASCNSCFAIIKVWKIVDHQTRPKKPPDPYNI